MRVAPSRRGGWLCWAVRRGVCVLRPRVAVGCPRHPQRRPGERGVPASRGLDEELFLLYPGAPRGRVAVGSRALRSPSSLFSFIEKRTAERHRISLVLDYRLFDFSNFTQISEIRNRKKAARPHRIRKTPRGRRADARNSVRPSVWPRPRSLDTTRRGLRSTVKRYRFCPRTSTPHQLELVPKGCCLDLMPLE